MYPKWLSLRATNGQPNMITLANDIGITTELEYDEDGFLNVDMSVFDELYWKDEKPCFVKQENKVLDTLYALLVSSSTKQDEERLLAMKAYSQTNPGINDPVLKVMNCGPDLKYYGYAKKEGVCDLTSDEKKSRKMRIVEHKECSYFEMRNYWTFVHVENEESFEEPPCDGKDNLELEGPASTNDASIYYPCNLKHCWRCCM